MDNQRVAVASDGPYFVKEGRPWFWLGDTVWSAFTNAAPSEWREYLILREQQGFNVLQINVLPQWDRSRGGHEELAPFALDQAGLYDMARPNHDYWEHAREMCRQAHRRGFVLALVVLWCDNVPDTWAAHRQLGQVMPEDAVEPYTEYVVETFRDFDPVWLVAGDTDFPQRAIETYRKALRVLRREDPEGLTTLHLGGGKVLHEAFAATDPVGFWMYQSGHAFAPERSDFADRPFLLGDRFGELPGSESRPLLNGEPCYEGIQPAKRRLRVTRQDVRRVVWLSLLSGAGAGVTYGAHGLWGWHHEDDEPQSDAQVPLTWSTAMRLEGAWDVALARWLFDRYRLFPLLPAQDLLVEGPQDARVATTPDRSRLVLYTPSAGRVVLRENLTQYDLTLVGLDRRAFGAPRCRFQDGRCVLDLRCFNTDQLVVAAR
jgi:hypothetical protein